MRMFKEPSRHMKSMGVMLTYVLVGTLLVAADAYAAGGTGIAAGTIGKNVAEQGVGVGQMLKVLIEVIGFGTAGFGLLKLIGSFKSHEPKGLPVAMLVLGALMVVIPVVISSTTQTVLQTDADMSLIGGN